MLLKKWKINNIKENSIIILKTKILYLKINKIKNNHLPIARDLGPQLGSGLSKYFFYFLALIIFCT